MSCILSLRATMIAALGADTALMALVNSVEDSGAPKMSAPALIVNDLTATDWGARGVTGQLVRIPLVLVDRSDRPDRLADASARVDAVMAGLPVTIDGWRLGTLRLDRSRALRGLDGRWSLFLDYLARLTLLG